MKKNASQQIDSSNTNKTTVSGLLAFALYCLAPINLLAVEQSLCRALPSSIVNEKTFSADGKIHLQADNVAIDSKNISQFSGNVVIQQKDKRIETDQAKYIKNIEEVNAKGNVHFISSSVLIKSENAKFNLNSDKAMLEKASYQSLNSRARGEASTIEVKDKNITELSDATYTTCDPNNVDWLLSANSLTLDNERHQGHASHVVVRFKDVPIFYFPYLRFPLGEERLSGFLFPYFGHSDKHGDELKLPYYWNIHPQMDATITPWYMSKRGTLLHTEFRYLTENNNGSLTAEYLNDDRLFKDDRERWQWKHQSQPSLGWQAKAEYNFVADDSHLVDFNDDLISSSTTYLIRSGDVTYNQPNWLFNAKAESHQILSGSEPYKRLPQVSLNSRYAEKNNHFNYSLKSEMVRFDHSENKVIGDRLHLKPSISYPIRSAAGFFEPKISIQQTNYNLQQTTGKTQLSRTIPSFSLNSGLFFERDTQLFNSNYIQTLEPQLFYVYVPYKDQSEFPVFDTSVYAFNVNQSFTDYRFNGIDRVGDDNRLTTALTTRFINQENGQEVFMARIGQIYYFTDREVQLPATAIDTRSQSHVIAEIKTQAKNWNLSSQVEWDPDLEENVSSSSTLGYHYSKFRMNLAHRFQRDTLETHEIRLNWELNARWQAHAEQLFDVRNDHIIENLVGVNYESCCWALRLSAKERYLSETETDRGIFLELVLKGLGGFGIKQ